MDAIYTVHLLLHYIGNWYFIEWEIKNINCKFCLNLIFFLAFIFVTYGELYLRLYFLEHLEVWVLYEEKHLRIYNISDIKTCFLECNLFIG